jgi:zinc metalloprotease ZmpB
MFDTRFLLLDTIRDKVLRSIVTWCGAAAFFFTTGGGSFSSGSLQAGQRPGKGFKLSSPLSIRVDASGTPRALFNLSKRYSVSPEEAARLFVKENSGVLGIPDPSSQLRTEKIDRIPGGSHVRMTQLYHGVPVFHGDVVVSANTDGQIGMVINNFKTDIDLNVQNASVSPEVALGLANKVLGRKGPSIGKNDESTLMLYKNGGAKYHLAYRVTMTLEDPAGDWEVFIDAATGDVLHVENLFVMHTEGTRVRGTGYVYLPDPLSASHHRYGDPGFVDNNDADSDSLTVYRTLVSLDSLTFEDGIYKLNGPYCTVTDIESPADPPFYGATSPDGFTYTRSQPGFEAVNVYYHVSSAYRHLLDLGFSSPTLTQIRLDPHGFQGQDNSHYSPTGNWIAWGTGGVDDAEDATIIWHEYGHAIQYNIIPTWGGGESGALGEGFGDYWAASFAQSLKKWKPDEEQYNWLFTWDGHNPFWLGRIVNDPRTYPFGDVSIHSAGQIWSTALMGIWHDLGREVTDRLVVKSFYYLGSNATGPDNAQAILQADRDLYGGIHLQTLVYWLGTVKHFIDPSPYVLTIAHTPLANTESQGGPFVAQASITSPNGLIPNGVKIVWGANGSFTDSAAMSAGSNQNTFIAQLPGLNAAAIFQYYIVAEDSAGTIVTEPRGAPAQFHTFQAGIDSVSPVISFSPLRRLPTINSAVTVSATITDNLNVDHAWIEFRLASEQTMHSLDLPPVGQHTYEGTLIVSSTIVAPGDSLVYRILAQDASSFHNIAAAPSSGFFESVLTPARGTLLIIDDGTMTSGAPVASGDKGLNTIAPGQGDVTSAALAARALDGAGFAIHRASFGSFDTASLGGFQAVVVLGGLNTTPFKDASRRASLVGYVQKGGRMLVEGGEVGYYYRKREGVPEADEQFRRIVLHDSLFISDDTSACLTFDLTGHRLFRYPAPVNAPIRFNNRSAFADRDVMTIGGGEDGTSCIGMWSGHPENGGIIIHTQKGSPEGSRTIYFTFSVASIADTVAAMNLVSNAVDYLTAPSALLSTKGVQGEVPRSYSLMQNYPNPFNPTTLVQYGLPEHAHVSVRVYNVVGQEIATLLDAVQEPGMHSVSWNGTSSLGGKLSSGVYFYRIEAQASRSGLRFTQTKKMIMVK